MDGTDPELYAMMVERASNYSAVKNGSADSFFPSEQRKSYDRKTALFSRRDVDKSAKKKEKEQSGKQENVQPNKAELCWIEEKNSVSEESKKILLSSIRECGKTSFLSQVGSQKAMQGFSEEGGRNIVSYRRTSAPSNDVRDGGEVPSSASSPLNSSKTSECHTSFCANSSNLFSNPNPEPLRMVDANQMPRGSKTEPKGIPPDPSRYTLPVFGPTLVDQEAEKANNRASDHTLSAVGDRMAGDVKQAHNSSTLDPESDVSGLSDWDMYDGTATGNPELSFQDLPAVTSVNEDGTVLYRHNPYSRSVSSAYPLCSPTEVEPRSRNSLYGSEWNSLSHGSHYSAGEDRNYPLGKPTLAPSSVPPSGFLRPIGSRTPPYVDHTMKYPGGIHRDPYNTPLDYTRPPAGNAPEIEESSVSSHSRSAIPYECMNAKQGERPYPSWNRKGSGGWGVRREGTNHLRSIRGENEDNSTTDSTMLAGDYNESLDSTRSSTSSCCPSHGQHHVGISPSTVGQHSFLRAGSCFCPSAATSPSLMTKDPLSCASHPSLSSTMTTTRSDSIAFSSSQDSFAPSPVFPNTSSLEEYFDSIVPHLEDEACTLQGRQILIDVLQLNDPRIRDTILRRLLPVGNDVFLDPNGCHVGRVLIEKVSISDVATLLRSLYPSTIYRLCTTSQYTRRMIQRIFECHYGPELTPLVKVLAQDACRLSVTQQGCIAIKNVLIHASPAQKTMFLPFLMPRLATLATDQYGNYVIQQLIDSHEGLISIEELNQAFSHCRLSLSCHKCASNVMEKLVLAVDGVTRRQIVQELIFDGPHCHTLLLNSYGNFVLQAIIQSSNEPAEFQVIYDTVASFLPNSPYKQKISVKLDGKYREIFQQDPPTVPPSRNFHGHRCPLNNSSTQLPLRYTGNES